MRWRLDHHFFARFNIDGSNTLHAGGLDYDHGKRLLELKGRIKARLAAPSPAGPARAAP